MFLSKEVRIFALSLFTALLVPSLTQCMDDIIAKKDADLAKMKPTENGWLKPEFRAHPPRSHAKSVGIGFLNGACKGSCFVAPFLGLWAVSINMDVVQNGLSGGYTVISPSGIKEGAKILGAFAGIGALFGTYRAFQKSRAYRAAYEKSRCTRFLVKDAENIAANLHGAAALNFPEGTDAWIGYDRNLINRVNKNDHTPLMVAAGNNAIDAGKIIIEKSTAKEINWKNGVHYTALMYAGHALASEMMKQIARKKGTDLSAPFHAYTIQQAYHAKMAINEGIDLQAQDDARQQA